MPSIKEKIYKRFYKQDLTYGNQYPSHVPVQRVSKIPNSSFDTSQYYSYMRIDTERKASYKEYDTMDFDVIASALDLWADDSTQYDLESGRSIYVTSKDKEVEKILQDLFYKTLNIEEYLWDIARLTAKYGDFFLRVYGNKEEGVTYCNYKLHPSRFSRLDLKGKISRFIFDGKKELEPWEVVHFRMPGSVDLKSLEELDIGTEDSDDNEAETYNYGTSTLYRTRGVWRQLRLLEDSLVLSRLARAPKRNLFFVNTGELKEPEAWNLVDKIMQLLKKTRTQNMTQPSLTTQSAVLNPDEDIVIPVSDQVGDIQMHQVGGDADVNGIADVNYYNNKFFASLKIPKAFLGFEDALNGRNTLRMLDVRYARTIKNIQRVLKIGLERVARIHIAFLGKDPIETDIQITFPYISTIEEIEKMESLSYKMDALQKLAELVSSVQGEEEIIKKKDLLKLLLRDYMHLTEKQFNDLLSKEYRDNKIEDSQFDSSSRG